MWSIISATRPSNGKATSDAKANPTPPKTCFSSSGFNDAKKIIAKIQAEHGITITEDSTFVIVGSPDASKGIILVGGDKDDWSELKEEDVKRWTELWSGTPKSSALLATIGWVKIKKKS